MIGTNNIFTSLFSPQSVAWAKCSLRRDQLGENWTRSSTCFALGWRKIRTRTWLYQQWSRRRHRREAVMQTVWRRFVWVFLFSTPRHGTPSQVPFINEGELSTRARTHKNNKHSRRRPNSRNWENSLHPFNFPLAVYLCSWSQKLLYSCLGYLVSLETVAMAPALPLSLHQISWSKGRLQSLVRRWLCASSPRFLRVLELR